MKNIDDQFAPAAFSSDLDQTLAPLPVAPWAIILIFLPMPYNADKQRSVCEKYLPSQTAPHHRPSTLVGQLDALIAGDGHPSKCGRLLAMLKTAMANGRLEVRRRFDSGEACGEDVAEALSS